MRQSGADSRWRDPLSDSHMQDPKRRSDEFHCRSAFNVVLSAADSRFCFLALRAELVQSSLSRLALRLATEGLVRQVLRNDQIIRSAWGQLLGQLDTVSFGCHSTVRFRPPPPTSLNVHQVPDRFSGGVGIVL